MILNKKQRLSLKQETALLKYIHTPTTRTAKPADGYKYIATDHFIDEINIEEDSNNGGVWLSFGGLQEFIKFKTGPRLFDNISNTTDTTERLRSMADAALSKSNDVLAELDKIQKGKPYSSKIIDIDFDLTLMEYSFVEQIKEGLSCAVHIGDKIKQQSGKLDAVSKEVDALISNLPFTNPQKDMAEIKYSLGELKKHRMKRVTRFAELGGELQNKKNSSNQRIKLYKDDLTTNITQNLATQKKISDLNLAYYTRFLENISPEEIEPLTNDLGSIQRDYETAEKNYTLKYLEMVALFEETKEEKNAEINIQVKNETYAFDPLKNVLLGSRIKHTEQVGDALTQANLDRLTIADNIKESMMRIFDKTLHKYREYDDTVKRINAFFKGKKISGSFYFKVNFTEHPLFKIKFLEELTAGLTYTHKKGELAFSQSVNEFIEDFFRKVSNITTKVSVYDLLNPKTFFQLSVHLTDEMNEEISGSTGQTYSAIALLGIARLSLVQVEKRKGLRFIILEEIGSLDTVNFNTFPAIAEEYHYQIITMAPKPFGANISEEWYVHHLIPGRQDININHNPPASYFKTKEHSEDLKIYQKNQAS